MRDLRTSERRGLVGKIKSWLRRRGTFRTAAFVLNVINLIARVIDMFK